MFNRKPDPVEWWLTKKPEEFNPISVGVGALGTSVYAHYLTLSHVNTAVNFFFSILYLVYMYMMHGE